MRNLFLPIIVLSCQAIHAQDNTFQSGVLPEVTLSYPLAEKLKLTAKIESMNTIYQKDNTTVENWFVEQERTDIQSFISSKLNPFWSLAGGYQIRIEKNNEYSHRTIQQASLLQRKTGARIGHRFRLDQTFQKDENIQFRMRYRVSVELPLEGLSLDPGEYYFIASAEPIYDVQGKQDDLETRLAGSVGYYFNAKHKIETGLDHRVDKLLEEGRRQRLWIKIAWFVNL